MSSTYFFAVQKPHSSGTKATLPCLTGAGTYTREVARGGRQRRISVGDAFNTRTVVPTG